MTDPLYRLLPGVDAILAADPVRALDLGPAIKAEAARAAVAAARERIRRDGLAPDAGVIAADTVRRARALVAPTLGPVVNATGVLIHTNLGRAPLPAAAVAAALGPCNLEYALATGSRGSRRDHAEALLVALSGAEAALVVNNNAAAVMLALTALARGREVLISRGELVEIGGSFRVPDILATSGATLREVGTTNRTWPRDYEAAIGEATGAILRVHPSNFAMVGFTARPTTAELAAVARAAGVPLLEDLGSGTFADLPGGLRAGEGPRDALAAGADLVCFSGDKLLGGPQAGIVLGRAALVDRLARHPLARALRVDKLALAALQRVLLAYRRGRPEEVPVWRMLHAPLDELTRRAHALAEALAGEPAEVSVVPCRDAVGGGSHPGEALDGVAVALRAHHLSPDALAAVLRGLEPPVVATIAEDAVRLHLRTVPPEADEALAAAVRWALA